MKIIQISDDDLLTIKLLRDELVSRISDTMVKEVDRQVEALNRIIESAK